MKQLLTTLSIILISTALSWGQTMVVTPDGLRSAEDPTKTYVVIDAPNKSASELYDLAKRFIIQNYQNPEFVKRGELEGDFLSFKTFHDDLFMATMIYSADFIYFTSLSFKEGRVKFEISNVEMPFGDNGQLNFRQNVNFGIYNKSGTKIKRENAKVRIETLINSNIQLLSDYLNDKVESDDW